MSNGNKKTVGYGSLEETERPEESGLENKPMSDSDILYPTIMVDEMHESYISQIRQHANNTEGPIMANFYVPRSRRR